MKTFIPFLGLLLLLIGCSAQKASLKFEVTRSFATGNTSFDGGLFIHGKNVSSGEEFSMALATQTSSSVNLNFGVWDIRVVGWDNHTAPMEGEVLCAYQRVDFKADNQRATLQATNSGCNNSVFAGPSFINTASTVSFRPVRYYTCGALFNQTSPGTLRTPESLTENFCNSYPAEYQQQPKYVKISLQTKLPGTPATDGLSSACILYNDTSTGQPFITNKNLPTKIPLVVNFYEEETCTQATMMMGTYSFPQGLEHTLSRAALGFDAVLRTTSSIAGEAGYRILAIASPLSKRGTTPFYTELPFFHCGEPSNHKKCLDLPPLPAGSHFVISPWDTTLKFSGTIDCSTYSSSMQMTDCRQEDGSTFLTIRSNLTHAAQTTFTFGGGNYNVYVHSEIQEIKDLRRFLGSNTPEGSGITTSLADGHGGHDDPNGGMFYHIKDMLSPALFGGFFWDQPCTSAPLSATQKRTISIWEDGMEKSFQAILTNPPAQTSPAYIRNSSPRDPTVRNAFNRRIIFRQFSTAFGFQTRQVIDLACDGMDALDLTASSLNSRIGRMEEYREEIENDERRVERSLFFWNTTFLSNARFEVYRLESESDLSFASGETMMRNSSSYTRAEKGDSLSANQSDLRIVNLNYHFHVNSWEEDTENCYPNPDYDPMDPGTGEPEICDPGTVLHEENNESLSFRQYDKKNAIISVMESPYLSLRHQDPGKIFSDSFLGEEKHKIRYFAQNGTIPKMMGIEEENVLKVLPNGRFLHVNRDDGNLRIEIFNGSGFVVQNIPTDHDIISADISDDGSKAIVVTTLSGTINVKISIWNGTVWTHSNTLVPLNNNTSDVVHNPDQIYILKTAILNSGVYSIAAITSNSRLFMNKGNVSSAHPVDLPIHLFPNEIVKEISFAKMQSATSKLWLVTNNQGALGNSINYCRMDSSLNCSFSQIAQSNASEVFDNLSATTPDNRSSVTISWIKRDPSVAFPPPPVAKSVKAINETPDFEDLEDIYEANTQTSFLTTWVTPIDTGNLENNPAPVFVKIPFTSPAVPAFRMNYRSLNPEFMIQNVFTNQTTFQAIGNGL